MCFGEHVLKNSKVTKKMKRAFFNPAALDQVPLLMLFWEGAEVKQRVHLMY